MTPTPEVATRPATAADTEFARVAHHAAYRGVVEQQFGPWDEVAQDGHFAGDWDPAATEVVLVGGVPAGYWVVEERGEDVHVRELVLDPSWQGRGVGTELLRRAQRRAAARGVPVRLGTFAANRARSLYERLGFRECGREGPHVLYEWQPGEEPAPRPGA